MAQSYVVSGKVVDVFLRKIINADLYVRDGLIHEIRESSREYQKYILPGFVDAHVHIESSMLIPSGFARAAVRQGTVATVSDPHEIANVMGVEGVRFMIRNGEKTPFKFFFGAPSCVPATPFESSGAVIDSGEIARLIRNEDIYFLAEMMNFPGVINNDAEVLRKIKLAQEAGKPVDGHAPGLSGEGLKKYADQNISTDHECSSMEEALEKIKEGMMIQIREGSAAKNFENLFPLIHDYSDNIMFCTDDCHPDDLIRGHINKIVARAVEKGADLFDVLHAALINPVKHYSLKVGLLQPGDPADFIVVPDLKTFDVEKTFINGELVFENNRVLIPPVDEQAANCFNAKKLCPENIFVPAKGRKINVIVARDGELLTGQELVEAKIENGHVVADTDHDILKIVVVNRYTPSKPAVGFVKNFNLNRGAIAGSIAHDSHNIIAIGTNDKDIVQAINTIIDYKGGIVACDENDLEILPLDVAGLMSREDAETVAQKYDRVSKKAKAFGSRLNAPFMTMAFMALLVIPELKIGDQGLFDVSKFEFSSLFGE
ncbi:MAG: adenine deaminase [Bacteroidales bacterium]|jgi:adenine deaminase|nr:adenine deaminase [Bacteroidales bacterium]